LQLDKYTIICFSPSGQMPKYLCRVAWDLSYKTTRLESLTSDKHSSLWWNSIN